MSGILWEGWLEDGTGFQAQLVQGRVWGLVQVPSVPCLGADTSDPEVSLGHPSRSALGCKEALGQQGAEGLCHPDGLCLGPQMPCLTYFPR